MCLLKTRLRVKDTRFPPLFFCFLNINLTPLNENKTPLGKAHARVVEDELIICTIWSRGTRYHFIFREERSCALIHTSTHLLRGSNTISRRPPTSFQSTSPFTHLQPFKCTQTKDYKKLILIHSWSILFVVTIILWDMSHHVTKSDSSWHKSLLHLSVVTLTNSSSDSSAAPLACMYCTWLWFSEYQFLHFPCCAFKKSTMCTGKIDVF